MSACTDMRACAHVLETVRRGRDDKSDVKDWEISNAYLCAGHAATAPTLAHTPSLNPGKTLFNTLKHISIKLSGAVFKIGNHSSLIVLIRGLSFANLMSILFMVANCIN